MVDIWTRQKRSEVMSKIRSKNTLPELKLRSALHKSGFRFRLHRKDLPGKPDLVFPKFQTVVFVHGCFWHQHKNCRDGIHPKSRIEFWEEKFKKNAERDRKSKSVLIRMGWKVYVVWECEINRHPSKAAGRLASKLIKIIT